MRYDLVADVVRRHLPEGGRVLDVGAGAGLVAERIADLDADVRRRSSSASATCRSAAKKFADRRQPLAVRFVRGDAERLPFPDASFDVVVMSEVIEHLLQPDRSVWEVSRVLKDGGVYVMTTNNASEMPLHLAAQEPARVDREGAGCHSPRADLAASVGVAASPSTPTSCRRASTACTFPHTHHIYEETRRLFAAAGLDTFHWSTFEFPPPQSVTDQWLEARGQRGNPVGRRDRAGVPPDPAGEPPGLPPVHARPQGRTAGQQPEPPDGLWPVRL